MDEILRTLSTYVEGINVEYVIEILILYVVIYVFLRFMEGTRGEGILKGIALLMLMFPILFTIIAERLGVLDRLLATIRFFGTVAIPVLVIVVQPELRRALVRLGQTRLFGFLIKKDTEGMVDEVVKAVFRMSRRKIGALIAIERQVGLKNYVERGTRIDAIVTSELLSTIFFPGSDLHDGAVVVQKERISAAGCLFPLSDNPNIGSVLGTRHRAALGISEETDAIIVVVSEETGTVSFVSRGRMDRPLDVEQLRALLLRYYAQLEEAGVVEEPVEEPMEARDRR